eukprot:660169-Rhodomonas_salina.1
MDVMVLLKMCVIAPKYPGTCDELPPLSCALWSRPFIVIKFWGSHRTCAKMVHLPSASKKPARVNFSSREMGGQKNSKRNSAGGGSSPRRNSAAEAISQAKQNRKSFKFIPVREENLVIRRQYDPHDYLKTMCSFR